MKHIAVPLPPFIVCGCYTPACAGWAARLGQRLDAVGVRHDFVAAEEIIDTGASGAGAKPLRVREAIARHPARTIIFVDANCRIAGTPDDFARLAAIKGDVGIRLRIADPSRRPVLVAPNGATLVLRPTTEARVFVERWIAASTAAPLDWSDQESLSAAVGDSPMVTITNIGTEFCAAEQDDYPRPVILHDGTDVPKGNGRPKWFARQTLRG